LSPSCLFLCLLLTAPDRPCILAAPIACAEICTAVRIVSQDTCGRSMSFCLHWVSLGSGSTCGELWDVVSVVLTVSNLCQSPPVDVNDVINVLCGPFCVLRVLRTADVVFAALHSFLDFFFYHIASCHVSQARVSSAIQKGARSSGASYGGRGCTFCHAHKTVSAMSASCVIRRRHSRASVFGTKGEKKSGRGCSRSELNDGALPL
jgi:hypothetical protein